MSERALPRVTGRSATVSCVPSAGTCACIVSELAYPSSSSPLEATRRSTGSPRWSAGA
jgi:hypothetical protein